MNVPGGMQRLLTVQVDGFEIACSLLAGFPQRRASGLFTQSKPALLLYARTVMPFLSGCFLHPSVLLQAAKIKFTAVTLQHRSSYSISGLLRSTKTSGFCKTEVVTTGLRWTSVLGTGLLCLSFGLTMGRKKEGKSVGPSCLWKIS